MSSIDSKKRGGAVSGALQQGYNSNLKNLLVKHQNNSVYCHRWRLLSGVSLICFYGIILEIFLAELYGWLTPDERAFARLYPWNHEVAIFLGRRRESEVIYRKNCTCRGCFARSGLNTHPTPRGNWVFILYLNLEKENYWIFERIEPPALGRVFSVAPSA